MAARPRLGIVAWCFTDGKAGHENQSRGLIDALGERLPVADYSIPAESGLAAARDYLRGRFPAAHDLPDPDLIIGAGHATHLPMLAARRARGGRVIVLMQPSLPNAWFDLCVIPEHDQPRPAPNLLVTRGALNRIRHVAEHDDGAGLFLVGGPAPHVQWDTAAVIAQIRTVLERSPEQHWWLTTSRRTPDDFIPALTAQLPEALAARLTVVPFSETDVGWLPEKLGLAAQVWVTQESVSMVYEALSSGAAVGLLALPSTQPQGRVARGIDGLLREGLVLCFADWEQGSELRVPAKRFDEAGRCADWICKAWLSDR
jgi:mitochondrial fission protein ELM1